MTVAPPADARATVLLVDDEPAVVRALVRSLPREAYSVVTAPSGERAIEHVRGGSIDVVVSDISMPGMGGIELLRAIREHEPDLPVVLVTGAPAIESAMLAIAHGALKYIEKPVDPEVLRASVERAVNLHRFARTKRQALTLQGRECEPADRAGLEAGFERALASLWMAFQPIIWARDGALFGYEALLRSEDPILPGPAQVLDAAERLGSLPRLGHVVRERAAKPMRENHEPAALFINLHPDDLLGMDTFGMNPDLLAIADRVVLEVTERSALGSVEVVRETVRTLRSQGFRIAVDDLGAGHAGLSSFATLEPDIVKLDMSLIRDIDKNPTKRKVVGAMVDLSHEMNMLAVAEGIETSQERDALLELGCDLLQGYLFSRPGRPFPSVTWG